MTELLVILALVLLNGVFAGTEIAVLTVRRTRLAELRDGGRPAAVALARLRGSSERFLATVQVGITLVSATAAAFGGARLAGDIAPWLARLPLIGESADDIALALVVGLVSYLSLVLGELVPKSLALMYAERYALLMARPMVWLGRVAAPIVWLLTGSSNLVLRLFGDRTSFTEARLSREEVLQLVEEARGAGSVEESAGEIAVRALEFDALDAEAIMVPRREVQAVSRTATVAELADLARTGHARLPVYEGSIERIVGFVNLREALGRALAEAEGFQLDDVLHPVPFVPETLPAPQLLRRLQALRSHLAVVVDEQGTVEGIVTIEDLVEELVGEIYSENDLPQEIVRREGPRVALVAGRAPMHEVNRRLELSLPEGDAYTTVAGLALQLAGRIPAAGEVLHAEEVSLEIVEASARRVRWVRLRW